MVEAITRASLVTAVDSTAIVEALLVLAKAVVEATTELEAEAVEELQSRSQGR